jgi:hypothetical protein
VNGRKGLVKLKEIQTIDDRLYNWSAHIRRERKLGTHPSDEEITKDNVRDLYDFTIALCEFIYVLSEKYNAFIDRKNISIATEV